MLILGHHQNNKINSMTTFAWCKRGINDYDLLQSLLGWLLTSDWKNFWDFESSFSDFQVIRLQHRVQHIFRQQCKSIIFEVFESNALDFFSLLFHPPDHVENIELLNVKCAVSFILKPANYIHLHNVLHSMSKFILQFRCVGTSAWSTNTSI